ncbi:MAG: prepilin-type N-terminal cleavage/methylation domain-containing protein [Geminicoccaceae bacterium]
MRSSEQSSRGFTLLELLVAMTLLGLLMTALFGGLRLGTRVWEVSDRVLGDESQALVVRRFLHGRLEQAFPARVLQAGNNPIVFAGNRTTLRFASTMPDSLGFGPFILELALMDGPTQESAKDLALRWREVGADDKDPDERVLVSGLSAITFAYFGTKDDVSSLPSWHSTWEDQEMLPDLIRLDVRSNRGAVAAWPPLIVSPKVNAWHETTF